jgi:hypothetical protein
MLFKKTIAFCVKIEQNTNLLRGKSALLDADV